MIVFCCPPSNVGNDGGCEPLLFEVARFLLQEPEEGSFWVLQGQYSEHVLARNLGEVGTIFWMTFIFFPFWRGDDDDDDSSVGACHFLAIKYPRTENLRMIRGTALMVASLNVGIISHPSFILFPYEFI